MQRTHRQHILTQMFIFSVTLLFVFPLTTMAQTVDIPDANLREAVEKALGKTPNARITAEDMATLTHFNANNGSINDLTGLETATNLERLELHHNLISDLSPLTGLVRLRFINLENNTIRDLSPLATLISLEDLHLQHNVISDLSSLSGLINLRGLNIGANLIIDLSPLTGLIKLEWIAMSGNPPADLSSLSGLTNLTGFHSWGTPILDLSPLAELPKLRVINICGGEISDISPLANATGLKELYFAGNQISDLSPLASLTGLTRLSLKHNAVSDISPLADLNSLRWLDLNDNAISDISPLADLNSLAWLDLSHNAVPDVSALASSLSLTWVGLNSNAISDVSGLEALSEVTSVSHFINSVFPDAGPKITGPWLWAIVPGTRLDDTDFLARASQGAATEVKVSTFGATEGKFIGDSPWELHELAPIGGDNINEMTDALGWGSGPEIYDHIVYGSVTLDSPREQNTTMLVGSSDSVKVWLNGESVHYIALERGSGDFQDAFPVTLKQGTNVLLVALDNHGHGAFSGFFGFAKDTEYTVNHPDKKVTIEVATYDVNKDGITNILDLILVGQNFGKANPTNARTDVNGDGTVNISDLVLVAGHLGELSGIAASPSVLAIA